MKRGVDEGNLDNIEVLGNSIENLKEKQATRWNNKK
jgi:hypothetical protein